MKPPHMIGIPEVRFRILARAFRAAKDHLEYCGYGDSWERECAFDSKLPKQLEEGLKIINKIERR